MRESEVVFFDLETTGFSKDDEIIQIAARCKNSTFNAYITPTRPIHWKAHEVTGLAMHNGKLYLLDKKVRSISPRKAFKNFMYYLRRMNKNIILVAHNCFGFDMPRIIKLADNLGLLDQFKKIVHGFSDSLVILRSVLSDQRSGKGKFTLKTLVEDFEIHVSTNHLHNAKYDVEALQILLFKRALGINKLLVIQWSKSIDQFLHDQKIKLMVANAKRSLQVYRNTLPPWLINKMSKIRIDRTLLRDVYKKSGFDGVMSLLSKVYYGKPCVTRNKKVVNNVCNAVHNDLCRNS